MTASERFDRYLPRKIHEQTDWVIITRARILLGLYATTLFFVATISLFLLIALPRDNPNWMHGVIGTSMAIILLGIQLLVYYLVANINLSSMIYSITFFTLSCLAVAVSGGWNSPVLLLFFCSPVVSFLVGGRQEGLYVTSLMFLCAFGLMMADSHGIEFMQIVSEDNMRAVRFSIWIASTATLVSCLTIYDLMFESALKHKNKK